MRTALAQEADALLMKNAACVPLYYDEVIRVHSKNLKGLKTITLNALCSKRLFFNRCANGSDQRIVIAVVNVFNVLICTLKISGM